MTSKFGAMFGGQQNARADAVPEQTAGDSLGSLNDDAAGGVKPMDQRAMDQRNETRTILGTGCSVEGKLVCRGPARIDGDVEGEISADESLIIGKDATVVADLEVPELHVSGAIRGNIVAIKRVTLAPTAHIQGDIRTPSLTIQEGAQISGKIDVGPIRAGSGSAPAETATGQTDAA